MKIEKKWKQKYVLPGRKICRGPNMSLGFEIKILN